MYASYCDTRKRGLSLVISCDYVSGLYIIVSNEFRFDVFSKWKPSWQAQPWNAAISNTLRDTHASVWAHITLVQFNTRQLSMEAKIAAKPDSTQGKKKSRRRGPRLTGVSRQRRMANARERSRVQTLNAHIERLRDLIPLFPGEKKPSKTETIRLAAVYISCLTEILETTPEGLERITPDEILPTFSPGLDDGLSFAGLPRFCFDSFSDNEGIHLEVFTLLLCDGDQCHQFRFLGGLMI